MAGLQTDPCSGFVSTTLPPSAAHYPAAQRDPALPCISAAAELQGVFKPSLKLLFYQSSDQFAYDLPVLPLVL